MNRQEHMQEAQDLLKRADEESTDGGNDRIAADSCGEPSLIA